MGRRARRAARAPINAAPCPHPEKTRFTQNAAVTEATRLRADARAIVLKPYPCVCGAWHMARPASLDKRIRAALKG